MILGPGAISPFNIVASLGDGFDPDAQLVFDRMTGLSDLQKIGINNFVVSEIAAGTDNYDKIDEIYTLQLGVSNGAIGWKVKTGAFFGDITFGINGGTSGGVNGYFDTNFNLFVDGVKYTLNDALLSAFATNRGGGVERYLSVQDGTSTSHILTATSNYLALINSTSNSSITDNAKTDEVITNVRTGSGASDIDIFLDGVAQGSPSAAVSNTVPNLNVFGFARNNSGTADGFAPSSMAVMIIGSAIGVDHTARNTNIRQLFADLGGILP